MSEIGRKKSSLVTINNLIDDSFELNKSIIYNEKINFDWEANNKKNANITVDLNSFFNFEGNWRSYFEIWNLDHLWDKHWKKGFIFKDYFFKFVENLRKIEEIKDFGRSYRTFKIRLENKTIHLIPIIFYIEY